MVSGDSEDPPEQLQDEAQLRILSCRQANSAQCGHVPSNNPTAQSGHCTDAGQWKAWCSLLENDGKLQEADLPVEEARSWERAAVRVRAKRGTGSRLPIRHGSEDELHTR